jgi:hypothetical protein
VELSDTEYEYRPPHYHEKICMSYGGSEAADAGNQVRELIKKHIIYMTEEILD